MFYIGKGKAIHRVVRHQDTHLSETAGSQMAVRLSAFPAGHPLHPGRFVVLIFVRGWVDPRAIVQLKGLGQFEKSNDLIRNRTHYLLACKIYIKNVTFLFPVFSLHT
jgi:hypothetical protein